jgi:hypothetical protein
MGDSESEIDEEDYLTIDTLSKEDLTAIVANPRYKTLLTELLNDSDHSADPEDRLSDGNTSDLDTSSSANPASRGELPATPNQVTGTGDNGPPPAKRKEGDGYEPSTSGPFDPVLAGTQEDEYQFTPPKVISNYLEKHFRRSLTKKERKAMLKADPKPQIPVTSPPNVDEYLGVFWKGKLNLSQDGEWKQVQNALLYALCGLWSQINEQRLDSEDGPIPASAVLDMIQCTLVLLGNANQLLSEKRRLGLLKSIDPNLTKYAKGEFPEAGKELFGSKFAKEIVGHVEVDTAICKASAIVNKGFRSTSSKGESPSSSKPDFFRWGQTRGHGTASGRSNFSPCNRSGTFRGRGRDRATAVSVAFDKGVSIKDILNTADWTSDSVFKKYYYKPSTNSVKQSTFSHAVLQA